MTETASAIWPSIRTAGYDGFLVSFSDRLNEPANRAALAFRAELDALELNGIEESSTSLVSTYVRFDPSKLSHDAIQAELAKLAAAHDWFAAPLPSGRQLWRVPTVFGGDMGPQLAEAADAAGLSVDAAIASITSGPVRVQTIGFAPGMPYLGQLSAQWDIPRQTELTAQVPAGGLCVALRQLVLFPVATPTGWRQIGQTGFRLFQPATEHPFILRPGDEVIFCPVDKAVLDSHADDPKGGATSKVIA